MDTLKRTEALSQWLELAKAIDDLGPGCPIPPEQRQPRRSKRRDISGLPKDWRERLLDRMSGSKHYIPALVACVSGCRPAELRKGVSLRIEGGMLRIEIAGAKVGPGKGQPQRVLEYGLPSPLALVSDLAMLVELAGGELEVAIDSPKAFSSAIAYHGHRTFPRSARRITPYCFRHQFASDAKRCFGDGDEVSVALGHRADRTRSSYGQAQMGRSGGGLAPSSIEATHEVRHVRTDFRRGPSQRFG
jgi:integrase